MGLRDSAIVAYAETKVMKESDRDVWVLDAEILEALLERTSLDKEEIDGLVVAGLSLTGAGTEFWVQVTADQLGLEVDFAEEVHIGGCSSIGCVARTAAALDAGLCTVALLLFSSTAVRESNLRDRSFRNEWIVPYGLMGPPGAFGLLSRRYEAKFGLDYEALGKLAVVQREHALLNDDACEALRKPITVEDYLSSRMISDPIRLLDCVMPADGAAGLIMMSQRLAREKGFSNWVTPIGYGERTNYKGALSLVDPTLSGHRPAGQRAFRQAGIGVEDVASFHPYDDFLLAIVLQLENLGFCEQGQGCQFIRDHDLSFRGDLPLNTGGGQISAGQASAASENLVEAVRQLMGEGEARQVDAMDNALVTGIGWINYGRNWGTSAALVLVPGE